MTLARRAVSTALGAILFALPYAWALRAPLVNDSHMLLAHFAGQRGVIQAFVGPWCGRPFYRPLAAAVTWLDHALFGDWATGYHVTNLALMLLGAAALASIATSLGGSRGAGWLAAGVYALHPIQSYILNDVSNRTDLLATLGCCAAVALGVSRWPPAPSLRAGLVAAAVLGACLSKETGFVAPALVALGVALLPPAERSGRRPALAAAFAAAAVAFAARTLALGGLAAPAFTACASDLAATLPDYAAALTLPVGGLAARALPRPLALMAALLLAFAALRAARSAGGLSRVALGAAWFTLALAPSLPLLAGFDFRFLSLPLAGVALCASALAPASGREARSRPGSGRGLAAAALAGALATDIWLNREIAREVAITARLEQEAVTALATLDPPPRLVLLDGFPTSWPGRLGMVRSTFVFTNPSFLFQREVGPDCVAVRSLAPGLVPDATLRFAPGDPPSLRMTPQAPR